MQQTNMFKQIELKSDVCRLHIGGAESTEYRRLCHFGEVDNRKVEDTTRVDMCRRDSNGGCLTQIMP